MVKLSFLIDPISTTIIESKYNVNPLGDKKEELRKFVFVIPEVPSPATTVVLPFF